LFDWAVKFNLLDLHISTQKQLLVNVIQENWLTISHNALSRLIRVTYLMNEVGNVKYS